MRLIKRIVILLLFVFVMIPVMIHNRSISEVVAYAKSDSEIQSEINALNSRISSINKEQSALQAKINSANYSAGNLAGEITNLTYEIDLIDEQILVIDSLLEQYDILTAEQESRISELEVKIEKEQKMLDNMIRLSYEYSTTGSAIEFIFSAEDFSDLMTRMDLLSYHLSYNDKIIENYSDSLTEMVDTKNSYYAAVDTIATFKAQQEELSKELNEKKSIAQSKRSSLLADAKQYKAELNEKQKYIDELDAQIKALAAMFANEDKTTYSGTFTFPLPANVYRITSYYGYRKDPFTGKTAYHSGYDFACNKGTKIYAADSGTVVIAAWNGGYGNCVTINHGGGIMTLYGHCSKLLVEAGQYVTRGQVIAEVGSSGRSTGNHLHFEVRKNGSVIDPSPYIGLK